MRNDLPETCFATLPSTGNLIILNRGETGYRRSDLGTRDKMRNQEIANYHNRKNGINPAQAEAMQMGSMCGFNMPEANPQIYFDRAKFIQSYEISTDSRIKDPFETAYSPVRGCLYQYQVAGKDVFYLAPSAMPANMMGANRNFVVWMDMVQGKPLIPVAAEWSSCGNCSMSFEPGSFASGKEINADYQIIAKVQVGPVEYALGEHDGKFPFFVTWERTPANEKNGSPDYYWGNYFENRNEAVRDFCSRASERYKIFARNRKPSIKAQLVAKPGSSDKPTAKPKDREVR